MAAEDIKKKAEEMRRSSETTAEDMRQTGEEFTRAASTFDLKGMSKAWKQGYLRRAGSFLSVSRADRAPSQGDGETRHQRLSANLAEL